MCELLGMSANVPTDIRFSFSGLMRRGGDTGPHKDGWGIAFYEGNGCRTFHDPRPSADSEIAKLIRNYSIKSKIVISHIRKATHGRVCMENTHPFEREMWGQSWTFAHNGRLNGVKRRQLDYYRPIGTTDSEHAFCWMLDEIRRRHPTRPRSPKALAGLVQEIADDLAGHGSFNILLSNSLELYAYCTTKLSYLTRRAPFGPAALIDEDLTVDFREQTSPKDIVTVVATSPLTKDEPWVPLQHNSLVVFRAGLPVRS